MSTFFVICAITKSSLFSARCFEDNVGNRSQTISTITGEESVFCLPLFFSCFKFFSVIIYPVFVLQILFWNLKPSWVEMTLRNPPYKQQSDPPPSPPTSATIPSSTPFCCTCSTPFGLNVFPPDFCVLLITILFNVWKREIYFPFILVPSPPYHGVIFIRICQGADHLLWILRNLWQEPL